MSEQKVPLSDLAYGPEEEEAALRVLRSRWLSTGPEVEAFETEFAAALQVGHAVAVSNGTAALQLAYLGLGIGPGDEVIQPAMTFVSSANMTVAVGARPVFADVTSLGEPTIDPEQVKGLISDKTKAVVVMHYGGHLCRMDELLSVCAERDIPIIEDACHAVGAKSDAGRMAGTMGRLGCFSFFGNKNLAVGEGGMVVTDDDGLADSIRRLRSHGMNRLTWDRQRGHARAYDVTETGFNYRLDDLRAALGRVQLSKLAALNRKRQALTARYWSQLSDVGGWILPFHPRLGESAHHLMVVVAPDEPTRDQAMKTLRDAGIQTSIHYPCITEFSAFANGPRQLVPISSEYSRRAFSLPLYPTLAPDQVDRITSVIRDVAG